MPGTPLHTGIYLEIPLACRVCNVLEYGNTMQVGQRHVEFLRILTSKRHIAVGRPQKVVVARVHHPGITRIRIYLQEKITGVLPSAIEVAIQFTVGKRMFIHCVHLVGFLPFGSHIVTPLGLPEVCRMNHPVSVVLVRRYHQPVPMVYHARLVERCLTGIVYNNRRLVGLHADHNQFVCPPKFARGYKKVVFGIHGQKAHFSLEFRLTQRTDLSLCRTRTSTQRRYEGLYVVIEFLIVSRTLLPYLHRNVYLVVIRVSVIRHAVTRTTWSNHIEFVA